MSGRSAYVRKEKTNVPKESSATDAVSSHSKASDPLAGLSAFPVPGDNPYGVSGRQHRPSSFKSEGSADQKRLDDSAYARVRKPAVPVIDISGIEKSSFRSLMDKKSEGIRGKLSYFAKKKKNEEPQSRPDTSATIRPESVDYDGSINFESKPSRPRTVGNGSERPGPPSGQLPPIPPTPQLKRFMGSGRPPQPWNKLRKDPELWDPHGDTLVFLSHEAHEAARPPPSFRVSSHVLERTDSRFFATILRDGCTEFSSDDSLSPVGSSGRRSGRSPRMGRDRMGFPNPPTISEEESQDPGGQISYELYFPAPINLSKIDSLRYHVTTRNVFSLLYRASIVGLNLFQALEDLLERIQEYMPSQTDKPELIIDYLTSKGIDDARNDPSTAISLLLWSELRNVRWEEGWREFFVHSAGMHNRLEGVPETRLLSPITKALLERANLEVEVRVQSIEDRFADFNFDDMWPAMSPTPPPERSSFDKLREFLKSYYAQSCGQWPLLPPPDSEQWLTRDLVKRLQRDFGSLYDYLVNRDVVWDGSEERSTRKWNIISTNADVKITPDTPDLPLTDILVAFDNRFRYPHIPHPYPLLPESIPTMVTPEPVTKASKKASKNGPTSEEKMAERRIALAYAEATNIYLLGPDFAHNSLVSAFVQFEKSDDPTSIDPLAARRGRWVLLYGILQSLASISVDTPGIRYSDGVSYHLNPQLRGTPPWRKSNIDRSASHEDSHCWNIVRSWSAPAESDVPLLDSISIGTSSPMLSRFALLDRNGGGSMRSSVAPSVVGTESDTGSVIGSRSTSRRSNKFSSYKRGPRSNGVDTDRLTITSNASGVPNFSPNSGFSTVLREHNERVREQGAGGLPPVGASYGPGIQKVDEWPIREESMGMGSGARGETLIIKDFDDYNF